MAYYINLLTPETYEAFTQTERNVVGFRERQRALAEEIQPGDILICYVLKTAKLVGVLEIASQTYRDDKPLFAAENDPYTVRMDVKTRSWLSLDDAVPDNSDIVWNNLSFTKLIPKSSLIWTGMFRGSLRKLEDPDGKHLEWVLNDKAASVAGDIDFEEETVEETVVQETVETPSPSEKASKEEVEESTEADSADLFTEEKPSEEKVVLEEETAPAEEEKEEEKVELIESETAVQETVAETVSSSAVNEVAEEIQQEPTTEVGTPVQESESVESTTTSSEKTAAEPSPAAEVTAPKKVEENKTESKAPKSEKDITTSQSSSTKANETPMQELKPSFEINPRSITPSQQRSDLTAFDSPAQMNMSIPVNDTARLPDIEADLNETARIQAMIAEIGERMNLKIWIPMEARTRVLQFWKPKTDSLLDNLPLNLDELTLKTVGQIDVLWVRNGSIARAFEVEDSSFYHKGILRMADLLAMQSGLMIHAYIVGASELQNAVLAQITRPVFALMNGGSLASACSFLSYDAVGELSQQKHLEYMTDVVLDEYSLHAPVV
jgi:hypothetical protein